MSNRPVTSKSRGVCKYYQTDRGCFAGSTCKFSHGEPYTPFDASKVCRYYAAGYCLRGETCWFKHVRPTPPTTSSTTSSAPSDQKPIVGASTEDDDHLCCICMEKPTTFGLLAGCSHVFCIECIRGWRDPKGKTSEVVESGVTKTCPLCRSGSLFVTPSSYFYPQGDPTKEATIARYKASMARVPCKHFQKSPKHKRFCPFGRDCFYKHEDDDGTPYVFPCGADHYMEIARRRHDRTPWFHTDWAGFVDGADYDDGDGEDDDGSLLDEENVEVDLFPWVDDFSAALAALRGHLARQTYTDVMIEAQTPTEGGDGGESSEAGDTLGRVSDGEDTTSHRLLTRLATTHSSSQADTAQAEIEDEEFFSRWLVPSPDLVTPPETRSTLSESASLVRAFDLALVDSIPLRMSPPSPHLSSVSPLGASAPLEGHPRFSTVVHHRSHPTIDMNSQATSSMKADELPNPSEPTSPTEFVESCSIRDDFQVPGEAAIPDDDVGASASLLSDNIPPLRPSLSLPDVHSQRAELRSLPELELQEVDPPVLTDGRGRVVWSSTAASRVRKGRTISQQKPRCESSAVLTNDTDEPPSEPAQPPSLVRSRSFPAISTSSGRFREIPE